MTDQTSGPQPGWYHAQGDPVGTERYWDGVQWQGAPQAAGAAAAAAQPQTGQPYAAQPQPGQTYVGQQTQAGQYAPIGQTQFARAENGPRFVAALIDMGVVIGLTIAVIIVGAIGLAIADALGALVLVFGFLGVFAFVFYNEAYLLGRKGQSIGKKSQNLKLIEDRTGEPVGIGMTLVRWIASGFINSFLMLDLIWILIDDENRTLSDKLLDIRVVSA